MRYGQFCPIAQAAEVLTERWTPLVLRELLAGSTRFNDIQRGVPSMSSSLLSNRLRALARAGVLERRVRADGRGHDYVLTAAGEALRPLIAAMGAWSTEWLRREITEDEADMALLMWDLRRRIDLDAAPPGRTVLHFRYDGGPQRHPHWWVVLAPPDEVDLCLTDPGFGVDLHVRAEATTMAALWLGRTTLRAALRARTVQLQGSSELVRRLPHLLRLPEATAAAR